MEEELSGDIELKELRNLKSEDWTLVTEFYRLWFAAAERHGHFEQARPSDSE